MRPFFMFAILALLAGSPFVCTSAHAADKGAAKGKTVSIQGKISTTKKDVDDYTTIKLTATDGTVYNITIDTKGKDLAKQYEGISVVVNGTVAEKDKEKWLTVVSTGEKKKAKK